MENEINALVEAWIQLYENTEKFGGESKQAKSLFWAFEELDNICDEYPQKCLIIINSIINSTQNKFALANLAAGPLEDLLARHGEAIVAEIEVLAKVDSRFRDLLQCVWRNVIDDETWRRVQKVVSSG
jgi:hypothetical protein